MSARSKLRATPVNHFAKTLAAPLSRGPVLHRKASIAQRDDQSGYDKCDIGSCRGERPREKAHGRYSSSNGNHQELSHEHTDQVMIPDRPPRAP
jgi:hypothetical protein